MYSKVVVRAVWRLLVAVEVDTCRTVRHPGSVQIACRVTLVVCLVAVRNGARTELCEWALYREQQQIATAKKTRLSDSDTSSVQVAGFEYSA